MSETTKIGGVNLLIILLYSLFLHFDASGHLKTSDKLGLITYVIAIQIAINFVLGILSFIIKKKSYGQAFLISAAMVLTIGFSTCTVGLLSQIQGH